MTASGGLLGLLIVGLTASQQISPKEAFIASEATNLQQLVSSIGRPSLDWQLAAEAASTSPAAGINTAVGCATGFLAPETLVKLAHIRAKASFGRRQDLTVKGRESLHGDHLQTDQEEHSVAQLPKMKTEHTDLLEVGSSRTVCVLISSDIEHE